MYKLWLLVNLIVSLWYLPYESAINSMGFKTLIAQKKKKKKKNNAKKNNTKPKRRSSRSIVMRMNIIIKHKKMAIQITYWERVP